MNGNRRTRLSRLCAFRSTFRCLLLLLLASFASFLVLMHVFQTIPLQLEHHIFQTAETQNQLQTSNFLQNINNSTVPIGQQIPVLVFCAKRANAIRNHLEQLIRLRPSSTIFPIIVSQDGENQDVSNAIGEFTAKTHNLIHLKFSNQKPAPNKAAANYFNIAQHYKWALDRVFTTFGFHTAIITEDDLDIASDFFDYFNATRSLLYSDPSIWCISAWNDNGSPSLVDWGGGGSRFWRTDFFPGLGWMLRAELWAELRDKWPDIYWDDWLRRPDVRKNRVCIRPEISRTVHNLVMAGKGSSNGLYKNLLSMIRLPEKPTDFKLVNIEQLKQTNFDNWLSSQLRNAIPIPLERMLQGTMNGTDKSVPHLIRYKDPREFRLLSRQFHLMADIRAGMPRTAYYGVVPFFHDGIQFFAVHHALNLEQPLGIVPADGIYDPAWDLMSKYLDFAEFYCVPKRWTGKCDPFSEPMRQWFRTKGWQKRLEQWGNMTVF